MLWTMALKDRIANTQDNLNISLAIDVFGKGHPNFLPFNVRNDLLSCRMCLISHDPGSSRSSDTSVCLNPIVA
jgi:hypothetical protein